MRRSTVILFLTLSFALIACRPKPSATRSDARAEATANGARRSDRFVVCDPPPSRIVDTVRVTTRDGLITLLLPVSKRDMYTAFGDMWEFAEGTVAIQQSHDALRFYDSVRADQSAGRQRWCVARSGPSPQLIQVRKLSHGPAGPGAYLTMLQPVNKSSGIRLVGFVRDTAHANDILQIAFSARLTRAR
jgi:hypothetical protein